MQTQLVAAKEDEGEELEVGGDVNRMRAAGSIDENMASIDGYLQVCVCVCAVSVLCTCAVCVVCGCLHKCVGVCISVCVRCVCALHVCCLRGVWVFACISVWVFA